MVRFGIIGRNFIVDMMLEAMAAVPEVRPAAIYSRSLADAEAFKEKHGLAFATDDLTADSKSFAISFSEPVNANEFGIAMDFAENWTLDWAEDKTAVTVNFDGALASGQEGSVIIFRLRDAENNMIGQNGIAGPVANQFTVK